MLNKCFLLILLILTVSCTQESYVWYNGSFSEALSEISKLCNERRKEIQNIKNSKVKDTGEVQFGQ